MSTAAALAALAQSGLYVLFDPRTRPSWAGDVAAVARAGVAWFQLRAKGATPAQVATWVAAFRAAAPGATLILNDDPQLARTLATDGVHVGPGDPSPATARALLGGGAIVGASGDDRARLTGAGAAGADYFGVGTYRATASKPDAGPAIGAAGVGAAVAMAGAPVVAIGGLRPEDAPHVRGAGAVAMAVYAGVWGAAAPAAAATSFITAWRAAASAR